MIPSGRRGRRRQSALRGQPADGMAPGELVLGGAGPRIRERAHRVQQHLLDRALDRAQPEALLQQAVRCVLVEAVEGSGQPRRGRRALAPLTGERDRRRDIVGLGERQTQRLDLGSEYWRCPPAERCGLGEAVAALPAAQGVGADAEHHGSSIGPDSVHRGRELCPIRGAIGKFATLPAVWDRSCGGKDSGRRRQTRAEPPSGDHSRPGIGDHPRPGPPPGPGIRRWRCGGRSCAGARRASDGELAQPRRSSRIRRWAAAAPAGRLRVPVVRTRPRSFPRR